MGYSVKINHRMIRKLGQAAITALEQTAEALHTDGVSAQVMPFNVGTMQNESTFVDTTHSALGTVSLVTSTPFARRMYYHPEYNVRTSDNKHAQSKWFEPWIDGDKKDFCKEAFRKRYKKEAGL